MAQFFSCLHSPRLFLLSPHIKCLASYFSTSLKLFFKDHELPLPNQIQLLFFRHFSTWSFGFFNLLYEGKDYGLHSSYFSLYWWGLFCLGSELSVAVVPECELSYLIWNGKIRYLSQNILIKMHHICMYIHVATLNFFVCFHFIRKVIFRAGGF